MCTNAIKLSAGNQEKCTHSPLDADHPTSADDFTILPHSTQSVPRILESYPEAVDNLCVGLRFCNLPKLLEIFNGNAVFVWWISKHNDIAEIARREGH